MSIAQIHWVQLWAVVENIALFEMALLLVNRLVALNSPRGSMSESLAVTIGEIGGQMVHCPSGCDGILLNHAQGILPRCLVLEANGREGIGSMVVGINPGQSSVKERQQYMAKGASYGSVLHFWESLGTTHPYFCRLRNLVNELGLAGPILWSDLVKCENSGGKELPPLRTFRKCTALYLRREVAALPPEWPLIAVGVKAYDALAYLFPERRLIGVPHPTGSRGHFPLPSKTSSLRPETRDLAQKVLSGTSSCEWLRKTDSHGKSSADKGTA